MNRVTNLAQGLELANKELAPGELLAIKTFATNVVDFNQKVLKICQRPIADLNQEEYDITMKCLSEELSEFSEAKAKGDIVGMIDALVDLKYFATGVMYKMGLTSHTIDAVEQAVHDANMEKKLGVNAHRGDGSAADAVKPQGWVPPEERISALMDEQMELFMSMNH